MGGEQRRGRGRRVTAEANCGPFSCLRCCGPGSSSGSHCPRHSGWASVPVLNRGQRACVYGTVSVCVYVCVRVCVFLSDLREGGQEAHLVLIPPESLALRSWRCWRRSEREGGGRVHAVCVCVCVQPPPPAPPPLPLLPSTSPSYLPLSFFDVIKSECLALNGQSLQALKSSIGGSFNFSDV